MASKRHLRLHSCTDKKRFATMEDAERHVAAMWHYHAKVQTPYLCRWGNHYHVTTGYQPGLHTHKTRGKVRVYRGTW